ncbi:MAG TPA: DNA-processing protein DprA [Candidatus Paceibacterota bacterium]|nr:DNA-processing protein DprA [Candidatus Paceibacterota bacterium]
MNREYPIIEIAKKDRRYPERLRQIADAPKSLYCRGNLDLLESECFAVVGTRMITSYGKEVVRQMVPRLAKHFTVVSGLAIGIDAAAHRATLEAQGKTIAVLGSGINDEMIGPPSNKRLAAEILESKGLILSEYPADFHADKSTFPQRNRIISGLSRGVLVVEADRKSGSLITAKCALEQNRDVFAVPGGIFSPKSSGANELIQSGAKLVLAVEDIIKDYSMLDLKPAMSTTDPTEQAILAILGDNGPSAIDAIIEKTSLDASAVLAALGSMEIDGSIKRLADGTYRKI